ncbi:MAG: tyrP-E, partial [Chlamydiia bacterium]|nr:tyrP-E [Chlamydiia bacterium]
LRDGLHTKDTSKNRALLGLLVLVPPLLVALTNPKIFLVALNYAGGFCTVILFGVLPALMAWRRKLCNRLFLAALILISFAILIATLVNELKEGAL